MNSAGDEKREGKISYIPFLYIHTHFLQKYAITWFVNRIRYIVQVRIKKKNMSKVVMLDELDV